MIKVNLPCYGAGWRKPPKRSNVALGHLRQGFLFLKHIKIMETKINLVPLAEMLSIEGISAGEMATFFDELAYDYARTVIALQVADLTPHNVLHEKTDSFLHLLRELREVFRQCSC